MTSINTIVFGATGSVGAATAYAARRRGGKVFLGVRNIHKKLPSNDIEQEEGTEFERIEVDLSKPETVRAAATKSKATRAFLYLLPGSPDGMKTCLEAMKSGGIEFVVFLSSAIIREDPRTVQSNDAIAWAHAQVEISLEETFGRQGYVTVRPAFFATNSLWWKEDIQAGEVRIPYPDAKFDWISSEDIGRVCGRLLVDTQMISDTLKLRHNALRLYGPQLLSLKDGLAAIGKAINKKIRITIISEEDYIDILTKNLPLLWAQSLVADLRVRGGIDEDDGFYATSIFNEASTAIEKYTGEPPTLFNQWLEYNKGLFAT